MLINETRDVVRHGDIVMMRAMRRVAVVSQILHFVNFEEVAHVQVSYDRIHAPPEISRKDSSHCQLSSRQRSC